MLLVCFTFLILNPGKGETPDLEKSFWQADFASVIAHLEERDGEALSVKEKLLWIECLARIGRGDLAEEKLRGLASGLLPSSPLLAAKANVYLAQGRWEQAKRSVTEALALEPVSEKAVLARVILSLFLRDFADAERWYKSLLGMVPESRESFLIYLLGLEVYSACWDPQALRQLYEQRASQWEDRNKTYADNLKRNARLWQDALKIPLFSAAGPQAECVVSFARNLKDFRSNVILVKVKGSKYQVLLDTGNRAGWTIHHFELLRQLKSQQGGRIFSEMGTHAGLLEGSSVFTRNLESEGLSLTGLTGLYIPKPQPDFYDANLNPSFIRNRIVTLDYVKKQLRLSRPGILRQNPAMTAAENGGRIPWLGHRYVYVPVKVGSRQRLALIETGAKDISLRLDFARKLGLPLTAQTRYLANGEAVSYHKTPFKVALGPFIFEREGAEVWPFQQFMDPLSGLTPDVVIGPEALTGSFLLTLDPFENKVLLRRHESPAPSCSNEKSNRT